MACRDHSGASASILEKTQEVVRKYMATVQEVACLLGENAAFTDATLRSIMEAGEKVKS